MARRSRRSASNGPVVPGMPNLHSHAFQRAMAGLTQKAGPEGDSFWAWRELMYRFLARLTPDDVEAIATQLYVEMLQAGYTSVAEFHYLHHDPQGKPYANPVEMAERIRAAASTAESVSRCCPSSTRTATSAASRRQPASAGSSPTTESVLAHARHARDLAARECPMQRLGVAPHSLRAVAPDELRAPARATPTRLDAAMPIHIHAAEQQKEVDDCIAWSGSAAGAMAARPCRAGRALVRGPRDAHGRAARRQRLARVRQAVAGLCPTTEGDLGDGLFNAKPFLARDRAASASAATAMSASIRFSNCGCSNTASA